MNIDKNDLRYPKAWYISLPTGQPLFIVACASRGQRTIRISQDSLSTALLPIIGQYNAASTAIGGTMKYRSLDPLVD
jgi:hypothetical protein